MTDKKDEKDGNELAALGFKAYVNGLPHLVGNSSHVDLLIAMRAAALWYLVTVQLECETMGIDKPRLSGPVPFDETEVEMMKALAEEVRLRAKRGREVIEMMRGREKKGDGGPPQPPGSIQA